MIIIDAVAELRNVTDPALDIDERPYMTTGKNRIVIYSNRLYSVRITEWEGRTNILSEPFAPTNDDIFSNEWEIRA